jgi:hypothetical protein
MPAIRVIDEHLLSPVLVYSGSGGVFENELVLATKDGLIKTIEDGQLSISVDIDRITSQISKKYINEIVFNEHVAATDSDVGLHFSLASMPTRAEEVQLWLNGQLLTYGEDYTVVNRLVTMMTNPLVAEDRLIASYSRPITMKQYAFGERLTLDGTSVTLRNTPTQSSDVMVFLNGQLLIRGILPGDNDYIIADRIIQFNLPVDETDIILATYSYN